MLTYVKLINNFALFIITLNSMDINRKIDVFSKVGDLLSRLGVTEDFSELERAGLNAASFSNSVERAMETNAWFRKEDIFRSLYILGVSMNYEDLRAWAEMYKLQSNKHPSRVAVVMAGNIPAVGFHDFISVLMAGHHILAKLHGILDTSICKLHR